MFEELQLGQMCWINIKRSLEFGDPKLPPSCGLFIYHYFLSTTYELTLIDLPIISHHHISTLTHQHIKNYFPRIISTGSTLAAFREGK
jgi:hypothetical protein